MKRLHCSWFFVCCALASACSYRIGDEAHEQIATGTTLTIPYVNDDSDGQFTDELIKAFAASGVFVYRPSDGALELSVKILSQDNKSLGWRYNRNPQGKRNKDLISVEGRRHVAAEVTLIDSLNDEVLLGPVVVEADLDFDCYEPDSIRDLSFVNSSGVRQTSIAFSLGQLDSIEGAYDSAWTPVSRLLAKKILDLILHASYY